MDEYWLNRLRNGERILNGQGTFDGGVSFSSGVLEGFAKKTNYFLEPPWAWKNLRHTTNYGVRTCMYGLAYKSHVNAKCACYDGFTIARNGSWESAQLGSGFFCGKSPRRCIHVFQPCGTTFTDDG